MREIYIAGAVLAFVVVLKLRDWRRRKGAPYPPGPIPLPLIGNVLQVPKGDAPWKGWRDWGNKYGDMVYFHTFGNPCLVINSYEIAHDLLDKRSAIYSYRPQLAMANEVIGWKFGLTSMDYSEKSRRQRRYMNTYFAKPRLPDYHPLQLRESRRLLRDLLRDQHGHKKHIQRMAGGITMMLTYGHQVDSIEDRFIRIAEKGVATIRAAGIVGAHIVDLVPWLRHIPDWAPGGNFKWVPPGTREDLYNFLHIPFEQVKKQMAEGTAVPCYVTTLMEETQGKDEEGVLGTAALTYSGGLDTTMSVIETAFTVLAMDPIIQARVQAEMDVVVGKDRLPTFEDIPRMPYLQCVITEIIRFTASTPVGVPHRLSEDDVYRGYFIPKNTMVIANQWAMLHNPVTYPSPERFNPDRFLAGGQPDPREIAFGFGRRACPGRDIAENTLWAFVMSVFYAFRVRAKEEGKVEYVEGSVRHPKPIAVTITPRRANSEALVRGTADEGM